MANIGISVLINNPSNEEKTPNPNEAPRDARNGKHMGQPIAGTMTASFDTRRLKSNGVRKTDAISLMWCQQIPGHAILHL